MIKARPTIIHPQLRDLILPLERGKVLYPTGTSIEELTFDSLSHHDEVHQEEDMMMDMGMDMEMETDRKEVKRPRAVSSSLNSRRRD